MSSNADCFIVLPANCASGSLILGRNAEDATEVGGVGVATEVCYYDVSDILEGKVRGTVLDKDKLKTHQANDSSHFTHELATLATCC